MRSSITAVAGLLAFAFVIPGPATAQDKKADRAPQRTQKVHVDNDRVRVTESVFKPGEANPMIERPYRVQKVLKGSTTVERTHANGKTDKLQYKEGTVFIWPADNVSLKNVGKSEVVIYTVQLKEKK